MADYISRLKEDLVEQFRGQKNIESFMEVLGGELQEVFDFFEQLRNERDVYHAIGKQLDGVGDIAVLTRKEAGQLAGDPIPFDILEDKIYRQYLIYKILKNTCDCTYPYIIRAFRMFWDKPLYYSEDPEQPATMIFDTGDMPGYIDTTPLFRTPLLRAAGVTLKLYARTVTELETAWAYIASGLGYAVTITELPNLERDIDYGAKLHSRSGYQRITEDVLPEVERDYKLNLKIRIGANAQSISDSGLPMIERKISYDNSITFGSAVYNVMEAPMNGISKRE